MEKKNLIFDVVRNDGSNMEKRHFIERSIKMSSNLDETWNVIKSAEELSYLMTDRQKENIISKLIGFSTSDADLQKIENYANSNHLRLHYVIETSRKQLKEVFSTKKPTL